MHLITKIKVRAFIATLFSGVNHKCTNTLATGRMSIFQANNLVLIGRLLLKIPIVKALFTATIMTISAIIIYI